MAYVYSNALNVSIALIVFGLIQIGMFVSCLFGCFAHFPMDFASPAWSGGLSVFAGLFGICMICSYKEIKWGKIFFFLSIVSMVTSLACIAITAGHTMVKEYALADEKAREGYQPGSRGPFVATGLAINGAVLVFGLILIICACYATWLNCCCDNRPSKGYVMTLDTVENTHYVTVQAQPPAQ
ncbi:uncharacterized protein LOC119725858 [Patiria miniata]|uniref:Uncharacterized protein n=1 Tax=Patiria miniata TaxID=46514 RepID=A0A913ZNL0_PATMI|nr:uncharacterized protein LOC119725858 [Patiria miniata]